MIKISAKKINFYFGLIFLLVLFTHYLGWLQPLEKTLRGLLLPMIGETKSISIKIGENYQFFRDRNDLFSAYEKCVLTSQKQAIDDVKIQQLIDENNKLHKLLNFHKKIPVKFMIAEVVSKEVLSTNQTVVINHGNKDNIKIGQPVIAGDGILVGKVIKTENDIALVRLINDHQSKIGATILNRDKSLGVVEGGYGLSLRMNLIPRDENIGIGVSVITSGLELNMPRGLLIGNIDAVENEPYQPFQQAVLTPAINLNKLTLVSVLLVN